jgi:hypothetical protein
MPPRNDIMMTGVYQAAPEDTNGSSKEPDEPQQQPPPPPAPVATAALKPVPGTSLKCLDDPDFAFEQATAAPKPKKPTYKVLEDPFEAAAASSKPGVDPMMASVYVPAPEAASAAAAVRASPNLSQRPPANEVLEGAREKFDKFWTGGSGKKE